MPESRAAYCLCLCLAAAAAAAHGGEPAPSRAAASGVLIESSPSPPSLPLERKRLDRRRVVEQRLADGTVLAHLDGEGMARSGLAIGPDGARPVCGPALDAAIDFRRRPLRDGDDRR
jgi:hypothetical protein